MTEKKTGREVYRQEFEKSRDLLNTQLSLVKEIDTATPALSHAQIIERAKKYLDQYGKTVRLAEKANVDLADFNPVLVARIFEKCVRRLNTAVVPDAVKEYIIGNLAYAQLRDEKSHDGILGHVYESAVDKMRSEAAVSGWPELMADFAAVEAEVTAAASTKEKEHTLPSLEDKTVKLVTFIDSQAIDWGLLSQEDPAKHTPIHAIDDFADFQRRLRYAIGIVDEQESLRSDAEQYLKEKSSRLKEDLLVFKTQVDVVSQVKNLRALVQEVLNRSSQNKVLQEVDADLMDTFARPETVPVEIDGRDELQRIFDVVGLEHVQMAEAIAIRLSKANGDSVVSNEELARLEDLRSKLSRLKSKYEVLFATSFTAVNSADWNLQNDVLHLITVYEDWVEEIIDKSGTKVKKERLELPTNEHTESAWKEYYLHILEQPNGYEELEKAGQEIMGAFYPIVGPKESHKNGHTTARFNGWIDAVKTRAGSDERPRTPDEKRFQLLWISFNNRRLVTDGMITYGQSRGMTASWDSAEAMKQLQTEAQGAQGFKIEAFDFFTTPEPVNAPPEKIYYPHAAEVVNSVELMKRLLLTPGSGFYRKEWNENNDISRDAIQAKVRERIKQRHPEYTDSQVMEVSRVAYAIATFAALRLDTFAESFIAGDSPAGQALVAHQDYFKEGCPPTGFFYAAYEIPKYLPEMEFIYDPDDIIATWKAKYIALAEKASDAEDFNKRINSIEQAIHGTHLVLHEFAPLRTHDEPRPFGYPLERHPDGMLKWQYPSMYRFLFDPKLKDSREKIGFAEWGIGFDAFKEYRKAAHADLDCHGKKPDEAVDFLLGKLGELISGVSKLKTNVLIDWNYIAVLMVAFIDRMYRAYGHIEASVIQRETNRKKLTDRINQQFGGAATIGAQLNAALLRIVDPHAPEVILEMSNNKLNTAGQVDLFRTLPATMPIEEKRRLFKKKIDHLKSEARAEANKLPNGPKKDALLRKVDEIGRDTLMYPFARTILEQQWLESKANVERHMMSHHFVEPEIALFKRQYPEFERSVKPFGVSTEKQKENARGEKVS